MSIEQMMSTIEPVNHEKDKKPEGVVVVDFDKQIETMTGQAEILADQVNKELSPEDKAVFYELNQVGNLYLNQRET